MKKSYFFENKVVHLQKKSINSLWHDLKNLKCNILISTRVTFYL